MTRTRRAPNRELTKVAIELCSTEPISGVVQAGPGPGVAFTGWLELVPLPLTTRRSQFRSRPPLSLTRATMTLEKPLPWVVPLHGCDP